MSNYDRIIEQKHFRPTDPRLKRHVYHDSRSKLYPFQTTGLTLVNTEHTRHIPVLDQGNVGSCVGNAAIGSLATDTLYPNLPITPKKKYSLDELGALSVYSDCEVLDGSGAYPPNDYGTYGLSAAKVLLGNGYISGYQHTFTLNDALLALTVTPIMVGMNWYNDMFNPDADGRVHLTGSLAGGHEVEAYKLDVDNQRVWFYNSWGTGWGVNGLFYLTWTDLGTLLSRQGDVTVLLPLSQPAPVPVPPTPTPGSISNVAITAVGSGYWVVELDGIAQAPQHSSNMEAAEHAVNLVLANPKAAITIKHNAAYTVIGK